MTTKSTLNYKGCHHQNLQNQQILSAVLGATPDWSRSVLTSATSAAIVDHATAFPCIL